MHAREIIRTAIRLIAAHGESAAAHAFTRAAESRYDPAGARMWMQVATATGVIAGYGKPECDRDCDSEAA